MKKLSIRLVMALLVGVLPAYAFLPDPNWQTTFLPWAAANHAHLTALTGAANATAMAEGEKSRLRNSVHPDFSCVARDMFHQPVD